MAKVGMESRFSDSRAHAFSLSFNFIYFFNWWKPALQCCFGFCCTTMRISHHYIHIHISLPSQASCHPALWVVAERQAGLPGLFRNSPLTGLHTILYGYRCYFLSFSHAQLSQQLCPQIHPLLGSSAPFFWVPYTCGNICLFFSY